VGGARSWRSRDTAPRRKLGRVDGADVHALMQAEDGWPAARRKQGPRMATEVERRGWPAWAALVSRLGAGRACQQDGDRARVAPNEQEEEGPMGPSGGRQGGFGASQGGARWLGPPDRRRW
jgi:hypothetical protein